MKKQFIPQLGHKCHVLFIIALSYNAVAFSQQAVLMTTIQPGAITMTTDETLTYQDHIGSALNNSVTIIQVGNLLNTLNGNTLTFTVPNSNGLTLTVEGESAQSTSVSNYTWAGTIAETGLFMLNNAAGQYSGMIQTGTQCWTIVPFRQNISLLLKLNMEAFSGNDCVVSGTGEATSTIDNCANTYDTCPAIIDVLLFATDKARKYAGGSAFFEGMVQGGEFFTNYAFERSDIPNKRVRFRWVEYNPSYLSPSIGSVGDAFETDAFVNQTMATFKADIAMLVTNQGFSQGYGYATIDENEDPGPDHRHCVVEIPYFFAPRMTLPHELSHLLGAHHNRSENVPCNNDCGDDRDICAHGFHFQTGEQSRYTIHALISGTETRILNFSNPDVSFLGEPTGNEDNNNARIIRNTGCLVSGYAPNPEFGISIGGSSLLCGVNGEVQPNPYTALFFQPAPGFPGNPPYAVEWWWNTSGIFNYQLPDHLLGTNQQLTISSPLACDYFYLHLRVTTSDGQVRTFTRKINTALCTGCNPPRSEGSHFFDRAAIHTATLAPNPSSGFLQLNIPEIKDSEAKIAVYDSKGSLICDYGKVVLFPDQGFIFDLSWIHAGYYFASVITEGHHFNIPFTLIK